MAISNESRARARALNHHQRRALKQIGQDHPLYGVGAITLASVVAAGWVLKTFNGIQALSLTASGQEIHDTLESLGWFPPDKDDVPPEGFSR